MDTTEEELTSALTEVFLGEDVEGLDDDLISYMAGMLSSKVAEDRSAVVESVEDVLIPFLDSVQCPEYLVAKAEKAVLKVLHSLSAEEVAEVAITRKLQQGVVNMSLSQTDHDKDASRHLWGMEQGVKAMANDLIDAHSDKTSMRDKRKQRKLDAERERKLLSSSADRDTDLEDGLVRMNVRAFNVNQTTDKTRDVQVRNVTVSLNNGTVLLESGELKFAYQRRYGLIGENGVGTLQGLEATLL